MWECEARDASDLIVIAEHQYINQHKSKTYEKNSNFNDTMPDYDSQRMGTDDSQWCCHQFRGRSPYCRCLGKGPWYEQGCRNGCQRQVFYQCAFRGFSSWDILCRHDFPHCEVRSECQDRAWHWRGRSGRSRSGGIRYTEEDLSYRCHPVSEEWGHRDASHLECDDSPWRHSSRCAGQQHIRSSGNRPFDSHPWCRNGQRFFVSAICSWRRTVRRQHLRPQPCRHRIHLRVEGCGFCRLVRQPCI